MADDGGSLEVVVEGVDAERTERREMDAFRRALTAPAKEHEVITTNASGQRTSTVEFLRFGQGLVCFILAIFAVLLFGALADCTGVSLPKPMGGVLGLLVFLLVFLGPIVMFAIRSRRRRQSVAKVRDRFTLTLDAEGFALKGSESTRTQPLEVIDRFEGERRLLLVSKDGRRDPLPLSLGSAADNVALADRLNDALVNVRAGAGGYRGAGPRVEIGRPSLAEDGSDEHDDHARRRI
jgi:hypothetical protein